MSAHCRSYPILLLRLNCLLKSALIEDQHRELAPGYESGKAVADLSAYV